MATSAQVQQLYIALLGRAADQPGLNWWLENINGTEGVPGERTLDQAAAAFTTSEEFVGTYGDLQGAELVTAVYQNLFERTPSAEEVAYWVEDGRPADQLLAAFLTYASSSDQTVINNKVLVAQYYTEAAGANYDLDDAAGVIAGVDGTPASVAAALQSDNMPVNDKAVDATLAQWQAAVEAKATFVAGLPDANDDDELTDADVDANFTTKVSEFVTAGGSNLTKTSSAAQQEAAFVKARNDLNSSIADQQAKVADAQKAVDDLKDGRDVTAYINAVAAQKQAEDAGDLVEAELKGAVAKFNALPTTAAPIGFDDVVVDSETNKVTFATPPAGGGDTTEPGNDDDDEVIAGEAVAASLKDLAEIKDGVLVVKAGVTETTNPGVTALLKAFNDDIAAQVAENNAEKALTAAKGKVGTSAADVDKVDTLVAEKAALAEEQAKIADLEKAITELKDAYALNGKLDQLNKAIEAAQDAVEANLKGGVVDIVDGTDIGTDATTVKAGDIFVFNGTASAGVDFDVAADKLFIGGKYALVDITDALLAPTPATTFGSADTLEVFWDATSHTLSFEKQAFSGSVAGSSELVEVVLTGVTDVELNNGFITAVA